MKKSTLLILVILFGVSMFVNAQSSDRLKQVFLDGEYFFLYEDYEEALYSYNTLYKRGYAENGNINYRMGQCYINIPGEKYKAVSFLEKATKYANVSYSEGSFKEVNAPLDSWFFLGIAYRINNQLEKGIQSFEKFKELVGDKNPKAVRLADKEISSCKYALIAMKNPQKIELANLGRPVSTNSNDFFPAVSGDESVIAYNSAQKFYTAVFFSKKVNNRWSPTSNITPEIQSDGNQFVSSISFDGNKLFLRYEENFEADIYMAAYENGRWTKSKALNKNINSKYFEGNACLSKDGEVLYFSSNRTGGFGSMDIYKSRKQPGGDWGPAENVGNSVNSDLNEDAPFISEDGKKLFFISQDHNSIGGYDIFYSVLGSDGTWSAPVNMGYPVNTTDDNLFFQPIHNGNYGYTSLFASDGLGKEDIFKLSILGSDTLIASQIDTIKEKIVAKIVEKDRELPADILKKITEPVVSEKEKEQIIIRTLFFDFNSSVLNAESIKELDHLASVLSNFAEIKIELTGTTDAIGSSEYNTKLSERRALSAKKYLISKGVSGDRLTIKGVGESKFIAINKNPNGTDCPEGRKYNRRVEIHLLDSILENVKIEKVDVPENLKVK